jgi:ribA/ribD-fused uncharacterized protein
MANIYSNTTGEHRMIGPFVGRYHFLSSFFPTPIHYEEICYPSVEHAYQAAKSLDHNVRKTISLMRSAAQAKRMGGALVLRPDWDRLRLPIMEHLDRLKFSDPRLRQLLCATYPHELIEFNSWNDAFWGVCRGKGENHKGKILMRIRADALAGLPLIS